MYNSNLKQNMKKATKFFLVFMFISVVSFGNIPLPFFQLDGQLTFESRVPTAYAAGPTFNLSGTLYSDTGSTPLTGSSYTIKAAIGTSTPSIYSTTTVSGTGAFSFDLPTSTAPTTWTLASSTEQNDWVGVAFGNGRFVAVSATGTNKVMYSSDGASWTAVNPGISINPSTIIFANGRFDVFGSGTTRHMYSKDGINWTVGTLTNTRHMAVYAEEDNKYLAINSDGNNSYSFDGNTWISGVDMTTVTIESLAYGEGKFRVGIEGPTLSSGRLSGSQTGVEAGGWGSASPPSAYGYEGVAYGNGYFVAVTSDTNNIANKIIYSNTGSSWTVATAPGGGDLHYDMVDFVNGYFVAIAHEATTTTASMAISADGITWQEVVLPELSNWQKVVYGNGRAVAVSASGVSRVMYSDMQMGPDTPITLWVDGHATVKATTFMKGAKGTTTVSNVPLYQDNLVTFNAQTDGDVSRTNLSDSVFYDSSDDTDILYTTNIGTGSTTASSTAGLYLGQGFTLLDHAVAVAKNFTAANSLRTGLGTLIFNGTTQQTATGTMTGDETNGLYKLTINNTSQDGATNRSVVFGSAVTASGTFAMIPGASVSLASDATSTFTSVDWTGTGGSPIWIYSSLAGARSHLVASGTIDYVNVRDSDACGSPGGGRTVANGTDYGNNTCWTGLNANNTIVISGTLYSDAGTTPVTSGPTIKLAIGTSTPVTDTAVANGSGAYSFTVEKNQLAVNMPITVFVDASTTLRAAVVTKVDSPQNNIAALNLYRDRVIVRQEGSTSTSLVELAAYDSTNDSDIQFTASSSLNSLNILNSQTLHIWTGDTFVGAASTTLSGSYVNNGIYTHNSGVLNLRGTSSPTLSGVLTGTSTLGDVVVSGDYEFLTDGTVGNLTINSGATTTASTTLTITGNYSNNGLFEAGNYSVIFGGSSLQTATGTMTGTSQFYNLTVSNTVGSGTTTQSVTFGSALTATGTMSILASSSVAFKANATSSFKNITWSGTSTTSAPVWVYSSIAGSTWYLQVDGIATIDDAYIRDSNACASTGGELIALTSINVDNNTCWTFLEAASIFLSGRLYSDEGTSAITSGKTIKLAIGDGTVNTYSLTADSSGGYRFAVAQALITSTSTKLTMWVDGDVSVKASLVSRLASTTANISDLDLYQNHIIVRHEGAGVEYTLTTADMEFYDSGDDSDIQFTASSTATTTPALSVNAGHELYIWPEKNLSPRGAVVIYGNAGSGTDGSLELARGAGYFGRGGSLSLAGNLTMSSSSIFSTHASGTIFTATTTGKTIAAHVASTTSQDIGDITFNGVGGGWTLTSQATTSNFTITNGAFTINSGASLSVAKNFVNQGTFSNAGDLFIGPSEGWDFRQAVHDGSSQNVSGDEASTRGIFFKSDGTKMYIVGISGDEINEYTLATPWTVSSRGAATAKSILSQTTNGWKIRFTPDGKLLYLTEDNSAVVYRYQLSTPWSIATAVPKTPNISFSSETGSVEDLEFSNDGSVAYVLSESNQAIYSYTLAVPWDLTTKTYSGGPVSVFAQDSSSGAIEFNAEGTKLYLIGNQNDSVVEYDLSLPWIVSSSSMAVNNGFFSVVSQDGASRDMFINPNGTRMYMIGNNSTVYTYNLDESIQQLSGTLVGSSALGDIEMRSNALVVFANNASTTDLILTAGTSTLPAQLSVAGNFSNNTSLRNGGGEVYLSGTAKTISGNLTGLNKLNNLTITGSYTASNNASTTNLTIATGGSFVAPTMLTVAGNYANGGAFTNAGTLVFGPSEGFDIRTAVHDGVTESVSSHETAPRGFAFNEDGTKMYVIGSGGNDEVNQYNLTTPWDVETKVHYDVYDTSGLGFWNIAITPDGKTLYTGLVSSATIYKHKLRTPWDLTTASYTGISYNAAQNSTLYDITFSKDGKKVYLPEAAGNVHTYALATPWEITNTSASYVGQYFVNAQVPDLQAITFNSSGTQAYLTGRTNDNVGVYNVSIPWDFSTSSLSYVGTFLNYSTQEGDVRDMDISNDGLKLILLGTGAGLHTYNMTNSAQTLAGNLTGTAALGDVTIMGRATTTFANNASTTDLTITNGTTSAPTLLSISGDYSNNSVFTASSGKVYFSGTNQQTATGSLRGTSAFNDLTITNKKENGTSSRSVIFGSAVTTTGTFTMLASTSAQFLANSSNTFQNVTIDGGSTVSAAWLRSSATGSVWFMAVPGTAVVSYANLRDSNVCGSAGGGLTATSSTDVGNNTCWTIIPPVIGSSTIANHDAGQVSNKFNSKNKTNETLFAYKLRPESGNATVTETIFTLDGAQKVEANDFSNLRLYRDHNNNASYDATDELVGTGVFLLNNQSGTITFATDYLSTTSQNYILVADWNFPVNGSFLSVSLTPSNITIVDAVGPETVNGNVNSVQHNRNNRSGGGSAATVGDAPPSGNGNVGGGGGTGGESIGNNPDYFWPSSQSGSWTNGAAAYDQVDGTYASTNGVDNHQYTNHGFIVPGSNTVQGIVIKLELSGTTGAGTVDVQLSWDGGTSWTATKSTATLGTSDVVYTLGAPSDLWGRSWSVGEFSNANFAVRVIGNPSSNTVRLDAIQARVYHITGGGGGGGGGAI